MMCERPSVYVRMQQFFNNFIIQFYAVFNHRKMLQNPRYEVVITDSEIKTFNRNFLI